MNTFKKACRAASFVMILVSLACKARQTSEANLKADSDSSEIEGNLELQEKVDALLAHFERDFASAETLMVGEPSHEASASTFALANFDGSILARAARDTAKSLRISPLAQGPDTNPEVFNLAIELEGLAAVADANLPNFSPERIASAINRAATLVNSTAAAVTTPSNAQGSADEPKKERPASLVKETKPEKTKIRAATTPQWECVSTKEGGFLPQSPEGVTLGKIGYAEESFCRTVIEKSKNGLICSVNAARTISPFRIRDGVQIGPKVGDLTWHWCLSGIDAASRFICLYDDGNTGPFARFDLAKNRLIEGEFSSFDECQSGEKSPKEPSERVKCEIEKVQCDEAASKIEPERSQEIAKIKCIQNNTDCILKLLRR